MFIHRRPRCELPHLPRIGRVVPEEVAPLEQAVHLMYFTAGNVQRRVMPSDRVFVRRLQEAVDLAVGVVIQLNLPHAELIANAIPRSLGYLLDGPRRELQVVVVIHEPGHLNPLLTGVNWQLCPGEGHLSIASHRSPRRPGQDRSTLASAHLPGTHSSAAYGAPGLA